MGATHHTVRIGASPSRVYAALQGGAFRISLTYEAHGGAGKSSDHTDMYHGWFAQLVPNQRVVERLEFETTDPEMQGEMCVTTHLAPEGTGTRRTTVHENLPPGVAPADNDAGWQESLRKLAALLATAP